jgi:DNA-binding NarL/FixJ family response regulator
MAQHRVIIVEDQVTFREMLAELLRIDADYDVVGQFARGDEALASLEHHRPDLVIIDVMLPDISGLELLRRVRDTLQGVRAMVVTAYERPNLIIEAYRAGAEGIATKGTSLAELRAALRRVAAGGTYYCPVTSEILRTRARQRPSDPLSEREQQIIRLVALGLSSKEIASELGIATKTVNNHRNRITHKLGAGDIATLTRYAISQGWVTEHA